MVAKILLKKTEIRDVTLTFMYRDFSAKVQNETLTSIFASVISL